MAGSFDEARELVAAHKEILHELGLTVTAASAAEEAVGVPVGEDLLGGLFVPAAVGREAGRQRASAHERPDDGLELVGAGLRGELPELPDWI